MFSWSHLGLVALGGAIGTAVRVGLTLAGADLLGPALVPLINVAGSFALGLLVGRLSRRPDDARARASRMFFGTGVLGGFTTYSALAVEAADGAGTLWGLGAVVLGIAAAWGGLLLGQRAPGERS